MKIKGLFKDWKFEISYDVPRGKSNERHLTKGDYQLCISKGFLGFADVGKAPLLDIYDTITRFRLWQEVKRECRRRAEKEVFKIRIDSQPLQGF